MTVDPWAELEARLPEAQRRQLADLLLLRLDYGWGEVGIIIRNHFILEFRDLYTIPSIRPKLEKCDKI